jgi:site-specific DNA recombinase
MRNLEIQRKTYLEMIKSHPNWIYAGVFYDIESGLRRSVRKSLDKLLKKAAKGKLITLSQSQCKTNLSKLSFIMKELRAYALENHVN